MNPRRWFLGLAIAGVLVDCAAGPTYRGPEVAVQTAEATLESARAQVLSARAQIRAAEIHIERQSVRAPVDGEVPPVNIRLGELAAAGVPHTPLLLLGNLDALHARAEIGGNEA
jgi:multidrug resistance efflux pump